MGLLQDLENIRADRMRIGMLSVAEGVRTGSAVHSVKVNSKYLIFYLFVFFCHVISCIS